MEASDFDAAEIAAMEQALELDTGAGHYSRITPAQEAWWDERCELVTGNRRRRDRRNTRRRRARARGGIEQ